MELHFQCGPGLCFKGVVGVGSVSIGKARGKGSSFCSDSFLALSSLTSSSDMQCFTVKPVMNLPPNYKDKPVPEQILK